MGYNPLNIFTKKYDLDWTKGTLRVIEDGGFTVFILEEEDGRYTVLNIIKE